MRITKLISSAVLALSLTASVTYAGSHATTLTIATVNNGDMIRMQGLTDDFTAKTGHKVEWVTLEENVLRQRVTTDITTKGGAFDIMTIGMYETPIWGSNGWLVPLDDLSADYNVGDLLPAMAGGLSHDGTLYAAPFYGESSMVMYRTDLMAKAGLEMPKAPSWNFIAKAARAMTDRDNEINGICLRGKAGWGEGGAFITAMSNSFGARWFDEDWNAQFDTREWSDTLNFYYNMMTDAGPAGFATNGFNENLSLFQQGKCGMWIDATVAASFVTNPNDSTVADSVGFALAPDNGMGVRSNWLWAVIARVNADATAGVIVSLNCETDFVAKNDSYLALANKLADLALGFDTLDAFLAADFEGITVADKLTEQTGVIGEKIEIGGFERLEGAFVGAYIHAGNKIATLTSLSANV